MKITYSKSYLKEQVVIDKMKIKKSKIKHMFIGAFMMLIPAIIFGMVLLSLVMKDIQNGEYIAEIRPYRPLFSPYKPHPQLLGQDLPQLWKIRISNGEILGVVEFEGFKDQGVTQEQRISLAEYKQMLIDEGIYTEYAWGNDYQGSK